MVFRFLKIFIFLMILIFDLRAWAGPSSFIYQGQIIKNTGQPLSGSTVFTVQILSPGLERCVLYEEKHTVNMTNTEGVFSLSIGGGARSGTKYENTSNLVNVFKNTSSFNGLDTCLDGSSSSYSPSSLNDRRRLRMTYNDGSGDVTISSDHNIQAVPYAWDSKTIEGLGPDNFVQINAATNMTQTKLETLFSGTNYDNLLTLANNTTNNYVKAGSGGAVIPSLTSDPSTPANGAIWFNSTTGKLMYFDGTAKEMGSGGGGGGALTEADIPTLSTGGKVVGTAITSGEIGGSTSWNTSGSITTTSSVTSSSLSTTSASLQMLDVYDSDNSNRVRVQAPATGDLTTNYVLTLPVNNGNANEVLSTDGNGLLSWVPMTTNIPDGSVTDAKIDTVGVQKITSALGQYLTYMPNGGTCVDGQTLKWNSLTGWDCGDDTAGTGDVTAVNTTAPLSGGAASGAVSLVLNYDNTSVGINGSNQLEVKTSGITDSKIAADAVTTAKIADSAVTDAKIDSVSVGKVTSASGQYFTYMPNGAACADEQVLKWDNDNSQWVCANDTDTNTQAVSTVFGRSGAVTAQGGDYTATQITNTAAGNIAATNVQTAINELDTDKVAKAGDTMTGSLALNAQSEIRFADSDSTNYVALRAPATVGTNVIWTLPAADGGAGELLSTDGNGVLSWVSASAGDITGVTTSGTSGLSGGAATGTPSLQVEVDGSTIEINGSNDLQVKDSGITDAKIDTVSVNKITSALGQYLTYMPNGGTCVDGQTLKWNSLTGWECADDDNSGGTGDITAVNTTAPLSGGASSGAVSLTINYDNSTIGINGSNQLEVKDSGVSEAKIATNAVTTTKIADSAVTDAKINSMSVGKLTSASGQYFTYMPNGAACTDGQVLKWDDDNSHWACANDTDTNTQAVSTVFGRSGTVTAQSGDYTATQITNTAAGNIAATTIQAAINELDTDKVARTGDTMSGQLTMTDAVMMNAQNAIRFGDSDSSNYVALRAPAAVGTNVTWTLPAADGGAGELLSTDGNGVLSWVSASAGDITGVTTGASSGLSGGAATGTPSLQVEVDGSTIEINGSNDLQIKDSGVTSAKIADGAVTDAKIDTVSINKITSGLGQYLTYMPNGGTCVDGQTLKWNSLTGWDCADDDNSGGTGDITAVSTTAPLSGGATSGAVSLTLNYDNSTIGLNGSNQLEVKDSGVSEAKLATNAVTTTKIADDAVTDAKIDSMGVQKITSALGQYLTYRPNNGACTDGQTLKWNSLTGWECGDDDDTATTPGGSTTQVQYNSGGVFAGSSNFVWDNTNARLGLGTASPGERLHIIGGNIQMSGTTYNGVRTFVQSDTASGYNLFYRSRAAGEPEVLAGDYLGSWGFRGHSGTDYFTQDSARISGMAAEDGSTGNGGYLSFFTTPTGSVTGGLERLRINSNGQVGVGTASTNALLTVEGVTSLRETSAPSGTANYGKIYVKSTDSKLYFMNDSGVETDLSAAGTGAASAITNTPAGNIAATTVQAAITELDNEKVAKSGDTMTGNLTINAQNAVRFGDSDSSNYVALRAPATVGSNITWTLPATDGGAGELLSTDGNGVLSWVSASAGDITGVTTGASSGLSGGAASGTPSLQVEVDGSTIEINGSNDLQVKDGGITDAKIDAVGVQKIISAMGQYLTYAPNGAACQDGEVLKWNSLTGWECGADNDTNTDAVTTVFGRNGTVTAQNGDYTAAQVTNTAAGNVASTTVQTAINELDNEKVAKTGDTMTGALNLPSDGLVVGTDQLVVSGGNVGVGSSSYNPDGGLAPNLWVNETGDKNAEFVIAADYATRVADFVMRSEADGSGPKMRMFMGGDSHSSVASDLNFTFKNAAATSGFVIDETGRIRFGTSIPSETSLSVLPDTYSDLTINAAGNVGVGTTAPNALLTVEGVTSLRETTAPSATTNYGKIYVKSSDSKLYFMNDTGTEVDLSAAGTGAASAITNTPAGNIAATTVQAAITELDNEKVAKSGDTMTGNLTVNAQNAVRYADSDSSNYVAIRAPAAVGSNVTLTLPSTAGSSGDVLSTDGSGGLSWIAAATGDITAVNTTAPLSGGNTSGAISLTLSYDNSTVGINGSNQLEVKDGGVTSAKITDGTIVAADIADDAVTTAKILDANVTAAKLADGAVTDAKIGTMSVNKITSALGQYLTYMPNGGTCVDGQTLKWNSLTGWDCGDDDDTTTTVGGSTTQVQYNNGGALAGSSNFVWDNTNSRLGIGTNLPGTKLSVTGSNETVRAKVTNTSSSSAQYPGFEILNYAGSTSGSPVVSFTNMKGDSTTSAVLTSGDYLGSYEFWGASNTSHGVVQGAAIIAKAEGTFSTTSAPSAIVLATTASSEQWPSERLRVDSAGRVGIGTSSPLAPLTVLGQGTGTAPASSGTSDPTMNFRASRGTVGVDIGMLDGGTGYIQSRNIASLGTTYDMSLQPIGGNVGIGTASPKKVVHIKGAEAGIFLEETSGGANNEAYLVHYNNLLQIQNRNSDGTTPVIPYSFDIRAPASTLYVNSSGNVGIRTSGPSSQLHLGGTGTGLTVESNAVPFALKESDQADGFIGKYWRVPLDGGSMRFDVSLTGDSAFTTYRTPLTLNRTGDVFFSGLVTGGFGASGTGGTLNWNDTTNARSGQGASLLYGDATNGPGGLTAGHYFHPFSFEYYSKDGSGNMTQFAIPYGTTTTIDQGMYMRGRYGGSWSSWVKLISENTSGNVGIGMTPATKLHVAGNIAATGWVGAGCEGACESGGGYVILYANGTIGQSSDSRLKENIKDITYGLDEVLQLRPVTYNFIEDKSKQSQIGFIAQDVQKLMPEMVVKSEKSKYLGLHYTQFSSVITRAIQEFYEDFKELAKEVMGLKEASQKHDRQIASLKATQKAKDQEIEQLKKDNAEMKARLEKIERMLQSK